MVRPPRRLALWMNGARVGTWQVSPSGDELEYAAEWVASPQGRPVSLSLPFAPGNRPHRGVAVRAYFENLLPDSQAIRERLARRYAAETTGAFDLLARIGRDCVGALQIVPEGTAPGEVQRIDAEPLNETEVARLLRATVVPASGTPATADDIDDVEDEGLRISIAGAQEKTALLWHQGRWWRPRGATPTTHILKLPMGRVGQAGGPQLELGDSVENEWLCAQVLAAFGLPVATCHPLVFEGQKVLAVQRFDRRWSAGGRWLWRLPQEDFCQATGTPPHLKYEADGGPGIDRGLELLQGSAQRARDRAAFFGAQVLFWMLCAPDGHAKNFNLALHAGGTYELAPLYDVISAYPLLGPRAGRISPHKVRLAMAVRTKGAHWRMGEIHRRHWLALGQRHGILAPDGRDAQALLDDLVQRTPAVVAHVRRQLPAAFAPRLAESILSGLLGAAERLARA